MVLHHELLTAPGASPTRSVVFLHGILGTGGNLRSHARRFIAGQPQSAALLIDLRAHGQSQSTDGDDTVEGAARDVEETVRHVGLPLHAVVGHSFGGKVALALARLQPTLSHVLTLDSAPGPRLDARGSEATVRVLAMLKTLRGPWPKRDDFVREVESHGEPKMLAAWLGMNLVQGNEGFVLGLTLTRIEALLNDYFQLDCWPVLETAAQRREGTRFHLVIGTRSKVYGPEDLSRAQAMEVAGDGYVTVDLLDAGHWVHVDDAEGVAQVLARRLG